MSEEQDTGNTDDNSSQNESEDDSPVVSLSASPAPLRNPSPPPELTNQPEEVVHGDKIGDTVFSKHWLFTTLLKLIQEVDRHEEGKHQEVGSEDGLDVTESLQDELCKLWDMSMNPDVVVFMQEFEAIDILCGVIAKSQAPRVTEICVGILGNMACNARVCQEISEKATLRTLMLSVLSNPDTPTLVETTRFLKTCLTARSVCQDLWIEAINNDSEDVISNVMFILQSSTNSDLLKNTGEFIDTLLDVSDSTCQSWATAELVTSLQEAVKQIGYQSSETLEVYFHIFQLLSTTESGIGAIVSQCVSLVVPLMKFLLYICDDELISLAGRENSLAGVISVLGIIFHNSDGSGQSTLTADHQLIRCLLKVLETVQHRLKHLEPNDQNNSNGNGKLPKEPIETNEESGKNNAERKNGTLTAPNGTNNHQLDESVEILEVLESHIMDLLMDVFNYLSKGEDDCPPVTLTYLNAECSRDRIQRMLHGFQSNEGKAKMNETLGMLSVKYKLNRLSRIIKDITS